MAIYLLGDIQGCANALERWLAEVGFSNSRDTLYPLGDLVNRGPSSLAVLRRLQAMGSACQHVLGNHDLHALAVACGARKASASDTLTELLAAPDSGLLLDWLRRGRFALYAHGVLMVHAGVLPQWSLEAVLALSNALCEALRQPAQRSWFEAMYGNQPTGWSSNLQGAKRTRVAINGFTRLRFCTAEGEMDFATKEGAAAAPAGHMPWFDVPGRASATEVLAFGHWSTLGLVNRPQLMGLDTGCVWGGQLTGARLHPTDSTQREIISVPALSDGRSPLA